MGKGLFLSVASLPSDYHILVLFISWKGLGDSLIFTAGINHSGFDRRKKKCSKYVKSMGVLGVLFKLMDNKLSHVPSVTGKRARVLKVIFLRKPPISTSHFPHWAS